MRSSPNEFQGFSGFSLRTLTGRGSCFPQARDRRSDWGAPGFGTSRLITWLQVMISLNIFDF
jgi:hypothetical protein